MTSAQLAELHQQCFETPRPWRITEFDALLDDPNIMLLTLPGGFAMARVVLDECELLTLAVDPAHRRQGLGRRLLEQLENESLARDATEVFLEVSEQNTPARNLYRACGYTESGRRPNYYRQPNGAKIDAILMKLPLFPTKT